jgi:endonuclease/exonuclease/phosphatase family metal-dependent hydrolase
MFLRGAGVLLTLAVLGATAVACTKAPIRVDTSAPASCRETVSAGPPSPAAQPIRWALPPDTGDWRTLDAWCTTVGPAVAHSPANGAAEGTASDANSPLVLLSWNIHVGGGDVPALVTALRAGDLTGGRPVRHFVLLLQEAHRAGVSIPRTSAAAPVPRRIDETDGADPDIVEVASELGLHLLYVPSMRNGREEAGQPPEDRGNALLSTMPLSDGVAIELPFERQRRVAVAATVGALNAGGESAPIRVASGHLDGMATVRRLWLFASGARARQARTLASRLDDDALPAALGADLNTWAAGPDEPAYTILRATFPSSLPPSREPTFENGTRLDYVFLRLPAGWHSRSRRVADRFNSDHHPILVELWMSAPPGSLPLPRSAAAGDRTGSRPRNSSR